ncbi:hypothetical protein CK203_057547 [Vitis vinifera]|uniref:Uncharacterized protein n=1 Tax=Vitis vinifera TaxID=29760 RepID=A0A438GGX2_VITVI|nr:hypothetical protein CK203_057547 [Vitis vinifera]
MDAWRGVEREKVVRDMWCGVERENVVRGLWCGVKREKVVRDMWCGVERENVVRGLWCGVEREKLVRKKMRELGIEGERWTGEEWVGIQTWRVCMGMRVVMCMGKYGGLKGWVCVDEWQPWG